MLHVDVLVEASHVLVPTGLAGLLGDQGVYGSVQLVASFCLLSCLTVLTVHRRELQRVHGLSN